MAESADINVDELRRRARRRLVGAVVLALGVAVVVPMLLETEQKPLGDDVSVKIPPIDDSKFVNRLSENRAKDGARGPASAPPPASADTAKGGAASPPVMATPPEPPKYDTRVPDAASGGAAAPAAPAMPVPAETGPAAKSGGDGGAAKADRPPAAKPAPSPPPPAPKSDPNAPNIAPATPQDGFAVQLAAFADDKGANALAARLKKAGFAAYTEPLQTSKGTLWRVRVGPYPSRDAAVAARDKLKSEGQSGIVAAIK